MLTRIRVRMRRQCDENENCHQQVVRYAKDVCQCHFEFGIVCDVCSRRLPVACRAVFLLLLFFLVMKMLANAVRSVSGECQFSATTTGRQKQSMLRPDRCDGVRMCFADVCADARSCFVDYRCANVIPRGMPTETVTAQTNTMSLFVVRANQRLTGNLQ